MRAPWPVLAVLALTAGCVAQTKLYPVPGTTQVVQENVAFAEKEGVRLYAGGAAWRGRPSTLENIITPVLVRIDNQSGRPLRLQYALFSLVGQSRFRYQALELSEIQSEGYASVSPTSGYGFHGGVGWGWGAPYWGWGAPGWGWGAPGWGWGAYTGFPWFGTGWGGYYPYGYYYVEPLPSQDMIRKALPQGPLAAGGAISGYVYFQDVGEREPFVTLEMRLVDAETGEVFGTLDIPFQVER